MKENILLTYSSHLDGNENTIVKLYKDCEFTTEPKHVALDTYEFRILNAKGDFQIQTIKFDGGIAPFNKETMKFGPIKFLYDYSVTFEILINFEFNKVETFEYLLQISNARLFYLKEFDYFEEFINLSNELTFKYLVMRYSNTYELVVKNPLKVTINGKNEDFVLKTIAPVIDISLSFIIEHETSENHWQIVDDYDIIASERKNKIFEQLKKEEVAKIFAVTDTETENTAKYLLEKPKTGTISVATDDDFVSAVEKMEQKSTAELDNLPNALFYEALSRNENVKVRKLRTQLCGCKTDEEFLAKVYCLRKAFDKISKNQHAIESFIQYGQNIFAGLILKNSENPKDFLIAYDKLMVYLPKSKYYENELKAKNIQEMNIWDILFDYILLESFDGLQNPPPSMIALLQNKFLPQTLKKSTLDNIIKSLINEKRQKLATKNGFFNRFYDAANHISPTLVFGFLGNGPQEFKDECLFFKETVLNFVADIFNFQKVRYSSIDDLAEDVQELLENSLKNLDKKLTTENLNQQSKNEAEIQAEIPENLLKACLFIFCVFTFFSIIAFLRFYV